MRGFKRLLATAAVVCAVSATASAQVKLEFKFPENQSYRFEEKVRVEDARATVERTSVSRVDIGSKRADGSVPLTHTIESMKTQSDLPNGRSVVVDTADEGEPPADFPRLKSMREDLRAYVGASYVAVMNNDGKVAGIEGTADVVKHPENHNAYAVAEIRKKYDSDALRQATAQQFGVFPDSVVRPGDSWVRTQTITPIIEPLAFERKYSYVGTEERDGRTLDRINVKTTSVRRPPGAGANEIDTLLTLDLKVDSSDGTILFDRELGRIVESTTTTRVVGDQKVLFQGKSSVSKIDQTITTGYSLLPAK